MGVRFINSTVVGFASCVALGIVAAYSCNTYLNWTIGFTDLFVLLSFLAVVSCILWRINRKRLIPSHLFSILVYTVYFGIGAANYIARLPTTTLNHFSQIETSNAVPLLQLKLKEQLKPDRYNTKYIAEIVSVNSTKTTGKLLVNLRKDTLSTSRLTVDKQLLVSASPMPLRAPKNPNQFNYARYMQQQGVYGEIRIQQRDILQQTDGRKTLKGISERIRNYLISNLKKSALDTDERSIVQALVLGQRKDIDPSLYEAYAAAGAIHILAVSGLHVGILYLFLMSLLKPLVYLTHGKTARSILILLLLWTFAVLAGLSPSVVRAVTMFSFFSLATALNRPTNSYNTLFLSFLLLLLVKPNWLFHVGFQLSYLAVFFILWLQPKLFKLYRPRYYLDRMFWGIFTVTIAAQAGIVPLSLYYFHQFPGLFFLTNLVVLPVLGVLLAGGLVLVFLAAFDWLPNYFAIAYNFMVGQLNQFIRWVARQELFLFEDIYFTAAHVAAGYFLLIACLLLWKRMSLNRILLALVSVCTIISVSIWTRSQHATNEFIVFHKSRVPLIGIKHGMQFQLLRSDTLSGSFEHRFPLKGYRIQNGISQYTEVRTPTVFKFRDQTILVLDSLGIYPTNTSIDIVVLTHSPKVNLDRLIQRLKPTQILADGSNYRTYVDRWRATCKNKKLPFHHTGTKGAFTLK